MPSSSTSDRILSGTDRFGAHQTFSTGVRWAPSQYKEIDQTPYLDYLEKNEDKTRELQKEMK
jgi:hypothetical protein